MKKTTDYCAVVGSKSGAVKGGSTQAADGKKDAIVVLKVEHNMSRTPDNTSSTSLGNQKHSSLYIYKTRDQASPMLAKMFTGNEAITSVKLDTYEQTGDQASNNTFSVTLENAKISSMEVLSEDFTDESGLQVSRTVEKIGFAYQTITHNYVPTNLETTYNSQEG